MNTTDVQSNWQSIPFYAHAWLVPVVHVVLVMTLFVFLFVWWFNGPKNSNFIHMDLINLSI